MLPGVDSLNFETGEKRITADLSIVIPAYNESERIGDTLRRILEFFEKRGDSIEIIVVDDGSSDSTLEICTRIKEENSSESGNLLRILVNRGNRGKGYSVRRGVLDANGARILMTDADMSTPIEEIEKLEHWLERGFDVVVGSRAVTGSKVEVPQAWYRSSMGKTFNKLVKLFVLRGIDDTQCGFKLFSSEAAFEAFSRQRLVGFSFDVEVLWLARRLGYRIREVPVRWLNSPNSRVRLFADSAGMFFELLRIKKLHRKHGRSFF